MSLHLLSSLFVLAAPTELTEGQLAQLETLRAEVASQIQLQAYDLLDELVYQWTQEPIFPLKTAVVLADVSVPVGFGSGLRALVENHFSGLIVKHPTTGVALTHCPQCTAVVVHSGAKGTVVARGVDSPAALDAAGTLSGSRHALFLDFEVEGSALVLRTRITKLEPSLPIVYARTLSTSTAAPALLRSGDRLKSASEARREYVDALEGRNRYTVPLRLGIRSYASSGSGGVTVAPFPWMQAGVEASLTQARAWLASFSVGLSWLPQLHLGWLAQARMSRLLTGKASSLVGPDLYGFVGASLINIEGRSAVVFLDEVPNLENLIGLALGAGPTARFAAFQLGVEMRVKNRIGASLYLESAPGLNRAPAIGTYLDVVIPFHSLGAEVSFCF